MLRLAHLYTNESKWLPPTDVFDTGSHFFIRMEIPGIKPDQVSINLQSDILTIKGDRRETECSKIRVMQMEINYGYFERNVRLPTGVDITNASASYSYGFLEVELPKADSRPSKTSTILIVIK